MKRFYSDHSNEYIFIGDMVKKEGVAEAFSTSYTRHSNGLPEKNRRTLFGKRRAMFVGFSLDSKVRDERVLHASHILNVTSCSAHDGQAT